MCGTGLCATHLHIFWGSSAWLYPVAYFASLSSAPLLTQMEFGSNVEDLAQQGEPHTPLRAVAGIDGGGAWLLMGTMALTTVCRYLSSMATFSP